MNAVGVFGAVLLTESNVELAHKTVRPLLAFASQK